MRQVSRKSLMNEYGLAREIVTEGFRINFILNEMLENDFLGRHSKIEFAEFFGNLRRGEPGYTDEKVKRKKRVSADFLGRNEWPVVLSGQDSKVNGFLWVVNYEKPPEFLSSASLTFGYQFGHDLATYATPEDFAERIGVIRKRPYFLGRDYSDAEQKGMMFENFFFALSQFRKKLITAEYKRR